MISQIDYTLQSSINPYPIWSKGIKIFREDILLILSNFNTLK